MKYLFQLIIIFAQLTLLGCSSLLKTADERAKVPLCKDNKPNQKYSLTIYAYNGIDTGTHLDEASNNLQELSKDYDWIAKGVIPRLLIRTEGFSRESNWNNGYEIESSDLIPRINHDVVNELKADGIHSRFLEFIPTSTSGDELVICPQSLCKGLVVPKINKKIELVCNDKNGSAYYCENTSPKYSVDGFYMAKENVFDNIVSVKKYNQYNELRKEYFLYDILSKSGLSLGETLGQNYYVVPEIEQTKLCADVMKEIPNHPNSQEECFKYNDKDEPRIKEQKFGRRFGRHLSDETLQLAYMDSVARDYAEQSVFSFEKKNEGQWIIYKIKLNPEFICKYGRPMSDFKTK